MGVVKTKKKSQGELKDRGTVYMFVGYHPSHACDVYRMRNLKSKHIKTFLKVKIQKRKDACH